MTTVQCYMLFVSISKTSNAFWLVSCTFASGLPLSPGPPVAGLVRSRCRASRETSSRHQVEAFRWTPLLVLGHIEATHGATRSADHQLQLENSFGPVFCGYSQTRVATTPECLSLGCSSSSHGCKNPHFHNAHCLMDCLRYMHYAIRYPVSVSNVVYSYRRGFGKKNI